MSIMQHYVPPTYENLQAKCETKDSAESQILLVHIPHGFARVHIDAKVDYKFGRVRVFGERQLGYNRSSRFNEEYQVPANCDIKRIKGKFDERTFTITMPKIPAEFPKQSTEQEAHKPPMQETQPNKGNDKEGITPQSSTGDDQEKTSAAAEVKDQKDQEGTSDQDSKTFESKEDPGHDDTSTPPDQSMPQNGQQDISQKAQVTKVESKGEADHETSTPPEATQESVPQKGQQGIPHKTTVTSDAKLQTEENTEQRVGKEINGKFGDDTEKKSDKRAMAESTWTRIKDMAASTTQAVTSLAKRFSEDDKQKPIYTGAASLVVALGVYASYKYRSSCRP